MATDTEKMINDIMDVLKTTITKMGNDIPAINELRDTYFVITRIRTKIQKQISVDNGSIASTIPTSVDTPLPPLNWA